MIEPVPTIPGWYPDTRTGGSKYWDGSRWSGGKRPARRRFAAPFGTGWMGYVVLVMAAMWVAIGLGAYSDTHAVGYLFAAVLIPVGLAAISAYMLRGRGPTTREVRTRLATERGRKVGNRKT
ncbi:DUF2510 domain-containing protein [Microbacterium sp. NPDC076911]|uniref:DUF2510 domain-containing protein n=1 Tax=Microbacterium sp. NPDC076911 TaxID=3154958 RepID=UPI00343F71E6